MRNIRFSRQLLRSSNYLQKRFHANSRSLDLLKLKDRGLMQNVFPETRMTELQTLLEKPQTLYLGFDPTADSLHIGNLIAIMALLHTQRAGHSPIALVGEATVYVGDPTGKTKDRRIMTEEEVAKNVSAIKETIQGIVNNHQKHFSPDSTDLPDFKILNNMDWYREMNPVTFLSSVGRHFRVGEMLHSHSVKSRLNSPTGISCTEFMYQVFQAADWLHLYQKYGCTMQIGGNDQLGNICSGFELINKTMGQQNIFGLLVPLLLNAQGSKIGKSTETGKVASMNMWLNPEKTSPFQFYQFFINLADAEVEKYLKLFTFYSNDEIEAIVQQSKTQPEKRIGQHKIAESITTLVHGESALASAQKFTDIFFNKSVSALESLHASDLSYMLQDVTTVEIPLQSSSITVLGLAGLTQSIKSDAAAIHMIKNGGFYLNHQRVTDPDHSVGPGGHILSNNFTLISLGKKRHYLVKWQS